ncbi:MAG: dTMP kinase [Promethearchaeota archaeon]
MNELAQRTGYLFVLEGIDGSGKTCACQRLVDILQKENFDIVALREPTSESPWGLEMRERSPRGELTPEEELELFIRDREWNVQNRIVPALENGKIVLMDRYFFATGAYQSVVTGISWREILRRNREGISAPEPDIVFILDVSVEVGLQRATGRTGKANLQFEQFDRLVKVRKAYLEIAEYDTANVKLIDSMKSLDEVVVEIHEIIANFIEKSELERV